MDYTNTLLMPTQICSQQVNIKLYFFFLLTTTILLMLMSTIDTFNISLKKISVVLQ